MSEAVAEERKIDVSGILASKAMIVKLSTSSWGARKADKDATKELLAAKKANQKAGSVSKALVDKDHSTLKEIREIFSAMKSYHNANTLPWDNDGGRLLPSTKHEDYARYFRDCQERLDKAIDAFVEAYPNMVAEASFMLGDLYNSDDYPHKTEMRKKFDLTIDFYPVPTAADFRVDIPDHAQEEIFRNIEERVERQHAEAMKKTWQRIFKTVHHMWERLSEADKIFRNSLIENLKDLVGVLPSLNILEDQALDDMTMELKQSLCLHTPEELRKDPNLRKDVADKSRQILDKISIFAGMQVVEPDQDQGAPSTGASDDQDQDDQGQDPDQDPGLAAAA